MLFGLRDDDRSLVQYSNKQNSYFMPCVDSYYYMFAYDDRSLVTTQMMIALWFNIVTNKTVTNAHNGQ